jgi:hypothetical protein
MASQLSLGTRIRCQSLRLRRPLRASEIDSLRGQAEGQSCRESKDVPFLRIRQTIICSVQSEQINKRLIFSES